MSRIDLHTKRVKDECELRCQASVVKDKRFKSEKVGGFGDLHILKRRIEKHVIDHESGKHLFMMQVGSSGRGGG